MTRLKYKLKAVIEQVGALNIHLECLEDLNQTIDDLFSELEHSGDTKLLEELCPYFGTVWPSARVLAREISKRPIRRKTLLELGCGLALPSLVAAKLGAKVTATDFHPDVPLLLRNNMKANALDFIQYLKVDWQHEPDANLGVFDWVIGSDVLYESAHATILAKAIARSVGSDGRALIVDPARPYLQTFVDEMTRLGFSHQTQIVRLEPNVQDSPGSKDVFVMEFEHLKA